jgi:hypothetical protein
MSPLFGSKDTKHDDRPGDAEALAEAQRLAALPLPQLAAEMMDRGFNPGPATDGLPSVRMITEDIAPGLGGRDPDAFQSLYDIVGEGMQLLEHACLIAARYGAARAASSSPPPASAGPRWPRARSSTSSPAAPSDSWRHGPGGAGTGSGAVPAPPVRAGRPGPDPGSRC